MDSKKIVLKETGIVALGTVICLGIMYGVFAVLKMFDLPVLFGGLLGTVLAIGNFFFMAVNACTAADRAVNEDVKGGTKLMRSSYMIRLVVIFALLFVGVKSGFCNVFASVIPLLFTRPVLTIAEFFRKKEA